MIALMLACATEHEHPHEHDATAEEPVELAVLMFRFQVHAEKLWHAGQAGNQPLAGFYLHELEETLEEIEHAGLVEDGHDLSAMSISMLGPPLEATERAVDEGGDFAAAYEQLVAGCNACHVASDHGFVVITVPTGSALSHQSFALP